MNYLRLIQLMREGEGAAAGAGGADGLPNPAAAAAAAAAAGAEGTMLDGGAASGGSGSPATWPSDWREKMVAEAGFTGDDGAKALEQLKRQSTAGGVFKSFLSAQQKLSEKGGAITAPGPDAKPEEIAAYHKALGVPETPDKYEMPKVDGFEFTADDKPMVDGFLKEMHTAGAPPKAVEAALTVYAKMVQEATTARSDADRSYLQSNEDKLRAKLGDEFRPQVAVVKRMLEDKEGPLPQPVAEALLSARDGEGNRLINNAEVLGFLAELGLGHYGDASLISGDSKGTLSSRMEEIKTIMKTDFPRYEREKLNLEYAKLLERQMGKPGAKAYYEDN